MGERQFRKLYEAGSIPAGGSILVIIMIFISVMTRVELKQLIVECIHEAYDVVGHYHHDFADRRNEMLIEIVNDFLKGAKRIHWPKLKAEKVARIWLVYGKRGTIFDEEGMNKIAEQMFDLVVRLHVSNELSGHATNDPREELEEMGYVFTDKQWSGLLDYLVDEDGSDFLSDYGLKPLENLALKLYAAETPEEKLLIVDRMLNVVHQRSDLAAMFIEGGTATLTKIANQGGYSTEFQDFNDQVRQQKKY